MADGANESVSQGEHLNSRNTKKKRIQGFAYIFTLNNYTETDIIRITDPINSKKYNYIFQEEKGANETPHLQGYIKYHKKVSFNIVKKLIPRAHIEQAKNKYASMNYCRKDETREGKTYKNFDVDEVIDQQYEKKETLQEGLARQQKEYLEELEKEKEKIFNDLKNKNYYTEPKKDTWASFVFYE